MHLNSVESSFFNYTTKMEKYTEKHYRYSGFVDFYKYFCRFSSILTDKDTVSQIDYQELEYVCSFLVCVK